MSFVLDNSVTMRWFFGDGKPQELAYAGKVLDAMKKDNALVPVTWGLEVANVIAKKEGRLTSCCSTTQSSVFCSGSVSPGMRKSWCSRARCCAFGMPHLHVHSQRAIPNRHPCTSRVVIEILPSFRNITRAPAATL